MKTTKLVSKTRLFRRERNNHQMVLSASSINAFQTCQRMFFYDKVKHIHPTEKSDALDFGSVVHKGLECIFRWLAFEQSEKEVVRQFAFQDALTEAAERSLSQEDLCKAKALLDAYIDLYFDEDKALFDVVEVEKWFTNDVRSPKSKSGECYKVQGYWDAVIRNRMTDEYWVVEHKTAGVVTDGYLQRVNIDLQSMMYIEAVKQKYGSCAGVIYDVIKKPKHDMQTGETDEEFEARKAASKTGRVKRKVGESLTEFYNRVRAAVDDGYLIRQMVTPQPAIAEEFKSELFATCRQINRTKTFCKCTCNCLKYGTCEYMDLCCNAGNLSGLEDKYSTDAPF